MILGRTPYLPGRIFEYVVLGPRRCGITFLEGLVSRAPGIPG